MKKIILFLVLACCMTINASNISSYASEDEQAEREALAGTWKLPSNFTGIVFTNSRKEETKADTNGELTFGKNGDLFAEFTVEEHSSNLVTIVVTITGKGRYVAKDNKLTILMTANDLDYSVDYSSDLLDPTELERMKDYVFTSMNNLKSSIKSGFYNWSKDDWVWKNKEYEIKGKQLKIDGKVLKLRKKAKK